MRQIFVNGDHNSDILPNVSAPDGSWRFVYGLPPKGLFYGVEAEHLTEWQKEFFWISIQSIILLFRFHTTRFFVVGSLVS